MPFYVSTYEDIKNSLATIIGGAGLVFLMVFFVIGLIIALAFHYIEAIPTFILAKKNGFRYGWIALLPLPFCTAFVLSSIPGKRDVKFFGKWSVKNVTAFIIYVLVSLIGLSIMNVLAKLFVGIPVLGFSIAYALRLLPAVAICILEYAFLRDVLDIYGNDKKSNMTASIIVVIANRFVAIVRGIYLWTLIGRTPAEKPITAEFTEE